MQTCDTPASAKTCWICGLTVGSKTRQGWNIVIRCKCKSVFCGRCLSADPGRSEAAGVAHLIKQCASPDEATWVKQLFLGGFEPQLPFVRKIGQPEQGYSMDGPLLPFDQEQRFHVCNEVQCWLCTGKDAVPERFRISKNQRKWRCRPNETGAGGAGSSTAAPALGAPSHLPAVQQLPPWGVVGADWQLTPVWGVLPPMLATDPAAASMGMHLLAGGSALAAPTHTVPGGSGTPQLLAFENNPQACTPPQQQAPLTASASAVEALLALFNCAGDGEQVRLQATPPVEAAAADGACSMTAASSAAGGATVAAAAAAAAARELSDMQQLITGDLLPELSDLTPYHGASEPPACPPIAHRAATPSPTCSLARMTHA